jgi:hypothetical protein
MRLVVFVAVSLLFVGCASFQAEHSRTLLMDRKTGEMKDCTVGMARSKGAYEKYEECIRSHEEQGYTIWSQY